MIWKIVEILKDSGVYMKQIIIDVVEDESMSKAILALYVRWVGFYLPQLTPSNAIC